MCRDVFTIDSGLLVHLLPLRRQTSGDCSLQVGSIAREVDLVEADLQAQLKTKEESVREATQTARNAEEGLAELRKIHSNNALERDRAELGARGRPSSRP